FLVLLFPTGRPASRRWTKALVLLCVTSVVLIAIQAITPGRMEQTDVPVVNPFGIDAIAAFTKAAIGPVFVVLFACLVAAAVSIVVRFRRADGLERQQIKWFALAAGLVAASFVAAPLYFWDASTPVWQWQAMFGIDMVVIPAAC